MIQMEKTTQKKIVDYTTKLFETKPIKVKEFIDDMILYHLYEKEYENYYWNITKVGLIIELKYDALIIKGNSDVYVLDGSKRIPYERIARDSYSRIKFFDYVKSRLIVWEKAVFDFDFFRDI